VTFISFFLQLFFGFFGRKRAWKSVVRDSALEFAEAQAVYYPREESIQRTSLETSPFCLRMIFSKPLVNCFHRLVRCEAHRLLRRVLHSWRYRSGYAQLAGMSNHAILASAA
jgi:hypothetical protein